MILGGLLTTAAIGSEIARNGLIGTIKGVGDILAGTREGLITVANDVKNFFTGGKNDSNDSRDTSRSRKASKNAGKGVEDSGK